MKFKNKMDYVSQDGFYKYWKNKYFLNLCGQIFKDAPDAEEEKIISEIMMIIDKMDSNVTRHLLMKFGISFILAIKTDFFKHCAKIKT